MTAPFSEQENEEGSVGDEKGNDCQGRLTSIDQSSGGWLDLGIIDEEEFKDTSLVSNVVQSFTELVSCSSIQRTKYIAIPKLLTFAKEVTS